VGQFIRSVRSFVSLVCEKERKRREVPTEGRSERERLGSTVLSGSGGPVWARTAMAVVLLHSTLSAHTYGGVDQLLGAGPTMAPEQMGRQYFCWATAEYTWVDPIAVIQRARDSYSMKKAHRYIRGQHYFIDSFWAIHTVH
jgi:hypothetical protein